MTIWYAYPGDTGFKSHKATSLDEEYGSPWERTIYGGPPNDPDQVLARVLTHDDRPDFVIPLSARGALPAGRINTQLQLPGLSFSGAMGCAYRDLQRAYLQLSCPELNPMWAPLDGDDQLKDFVGKPVSIFSPTNFTAPLNTVINSTEEFLPLTKKVLKRSYRENAQLARVSVGVLYCLVEEQVSEPFWEVTALLGQGGVPLFVFPPLRPKLSENTIIGYTKDEVIDAIPFIEKIISALYLQNCVATFQFRGEKVFRVLPTIKMRHLRYYEAVYGTNPLDKVLEVFGGQKP